MNQSNIFHFFRTKKGSEVSFTFKWLGGAIYDVCVGLFLPPNKVSMQRMKNDYLNLNLWSFKGGSWPFRTNFKGSKKSLALIRAINATHHTCAEIALATSASSLSSRMTLLLLLLDYILWWLSPKLYKKANSLMNSNLSWQGH